MNAFARYHPFVNLIYFICVFTFSCVFMHPVCLATSLVCAGITAAWFAGRGFAKSLLFIAPTALVFGLVNPLFNHRGVTVLGYFPGGNPLTAESVIYGIAAAAMLISVMCWFLAFNKIMTSDKFVYLFGKVMPSLSLVISMTLRFVPKFIGELKALAQAQAGIGKGATGGGRLSSLKRGIKLLYAQMGLAMENAVDTADSMRCRGYGKKDRTAYSTFRFKSSDGIFLAVTLALTGYIVFGAVKGQLWGDYFPALTYKTEGIWQTTIFAAYFLLGLLPVIIGIGEEIKWKILKSKI